MKAVSAQGVSCCVFDNHQKLCCTCKPTFHTCSVDPVVHLCPLESSMPKHLSTTGPEVECKQLQKSFDAWIAVWHRTQLWTSVRCTCVHEFAPWACHLGPSITSRYATMFVIWMCLWIVKLEKMFWLISVNGSNACRSSNSTSHRGSSVLLCSENHLISSSGKKEYHISKENRLIRHTLMIEREREREREREERIILTWLFDSVARWLYYLINIRPYGTMKMCPIANILAKLLCIYLISPQTYCQWLWFFAKVVKYFRIWSHCSSERM